VKKRLIKISIGVVLVLGFSLLLTHCSFQRYAKKSFERAKKEIPFDVIIVPGVPYQDTAINVIYKARLIWAKYLYDSGFTKNIIFSGSAVYTPYYEATTMMMYADSLGLPTENLFAETEALHSTENIYYGWKMAKAMGFKKIALATDPFQSRLLKSFMEEYTPGVYTIPIQFEKIDTKSIVFPKINDRAAFVDNFISLPKRQDFWERLRGTRGKRVKEELEKEKNN
jgi:vancomycin permeability regulator SanA